MHRPMLLAGDDDGSRMIVDSGGGCRGGNMGCDALVAVVDLVVVAMMEVMEHSRF